MTYAKIMESSWAAVRLPVPVRAGARAATGIEYGRASACGTLLFQITFGNY